MAFLKTNPSEANAAAHHWRGPYRSRLLDILEIEIESPEQLVIERTPL